MVKYITFIALALFLSSCSFKFTKVYINLEDIGSCEIGDNIEDYNEAYSGFLVMPYSMHTLRNIPGKKTYQVIFFQRLLGASEFTYMPYLFKNGKLLAFGSTEDFLRSDDEIIRACGAEISNLIVEDRMQEENEL